MHPQCPLHIRLPLTILLQRADDGTDAALCRGLRFDVKMLCQQLRLLGTFPLTLDGPDTAIVIGDQTMSRSRLPLLITPFVPSCALNVQDHQGWGYTSGLKV